MSLKKFRRYKIRDFSIKNTEPRLFRKSNHRDNDKNKLRTFQPRGGENFKNIEPQRKKSGPLKIVNFHRIFVSNNYNTIFNF